MSDGEPSDYAWNTFGENGNGLAIKTTIDRLRRALAAITGPDGPLHISQVQYVDHENDLVDGVNMLEVCFSIREDFELECEARALISLDGTAAKILLGQHGPSGPLIEILQKPEFTTVAAHRTKIVVAIDPKLLIEEIVIGAGVSDEDRANVLAAISEAGLEHIVRA